MMVKNKLIVACLVGSCGFLAPVSTQAAPETVVQKSFVVKDIRVEGRRRVKLGAVLNDLPIQVGDSVDSVRIADAINKLYRTGEFERIDISSEVDTLVVKVVERKTISQIRFVGNKELKEKDLLDKLKIQGVAPSEPFNPTIMGSIVAALEDFYHSLGKYSASVVFNAKPSSDGTVELEFVFMEGEAAKITQINILGNKAFPEKELIRVLELSDTPSLIPFLSGNQYQQQKLRGDLESLRSFYMDRGYLQFKIQSAQVSLSPDKKGVYLTINVDEGNPIVINKIEMQGDFAGHKKALSDKITYQSGEFFSAKKVVDTEKKMAEYLGRFGYAYPEIQTIPRIDEKSNKVDLTIQVDPGKRIYVRHIHFVGNKMTKDDVLRREMRQLEATWLSSEQVERSKRRLNRLGFFKNVTIETQRVLGTDDVVDLLIRVEEARSGSINFGISYGFDSGLGGHISLKQNNFLGTGDYVGINLRMNRNSTEIDLERFDPYFTVNNVSLGTRAFFSKFEAGKDNIIDYTDKSFGLDLSTGIPLDEYNRLRVSFGAKHSELLQGQSYEQIRSFWERVGESILDGATARFTVYNLSPTWIRDTLDRGLFPTEGSSQELTGKVTLPFSDLKYWKAGFENRYYWPIDSHGEWVLFNRTYIAYGNGYGGRGKEDRQLPFFENYYAGGSEYLRGFKENTVGPKALLTSDSLGSSQLIATKRSLGGNAIAANGLHLIFPTPFIPQNWKDHIRTAAFIDMGNVWDTYYDYDALKRQCTMNCNYLNGSSEPQNIRISAGLHLQWITPFGPVSVVLAKALKKSDGDETRVFDFSIGRTF